jgi:hypothetical protein
VAPPKRKAGGRVTPKGTKPGSVPRATYTPPVNDDEHPHRAASPSSRYTPPTPKWEKQSPRWVPVLMFGLLIIGGLMIILNYLELLPGAASNWYLMGGLAAILGGIITATQYR